MVCQLYLYLSNTEDCLRNEAVVLVKNPFDLLLCVTCFLIGHSSVATARLGSATARSRRLPLKMAH
jgi:predicted alpha/beta-fold hydrolase